jgi:hypothetical protein
VGSREANGNALSGWSLHSPVYTFSQGAPTHPKYLRQLKRFVSRFYSQRHYVCDENHCAACASRCHFLVPQSHNYSFYRVRAGVSMLNKAEIRRRKQQSARDKAKHREEQQTPTTTCTGQGQASYRTSQILLDNTTATATASRARRNGGAGRRMDGSRNREDKGVKCLSFYSCNANNADSTRLWGLRRRFG